MKRILTLVALAVLPGRRPAQVRSVVVIAHRGEHRHHPENTMPHSLRRSASVPTMSKWMSAPRLDAGSGVRVPTFDEGLDYARGRNSAGISKAVQELNPRLKIMPEAGQAESAQQLVDSLHRKVLAFSASDFKPEIIAIAKRANALIYVDRLGAADTAAVWQEAIDWGADGIQTDHPEALVTYLREKGYKK